MEIIAIERALAVVDEIDILAAASNKFL